MKRFVKRIDQCRSTIILLVLMACSGGLFFEASAAAEKSAGDEIISLDVADKPLGEVLKNISDAAGCRIKIDAAWEDYPVTASFKNEPLYRVLKRLFRNLNNAIIYGSDRTIKIIIYDEGTPAGKAGGYPVASRPAEAAVIQGQPYGEATAPQPEVQAPEENTGLENTVQPSEESSESNAEINQTDAENPEAGEVSGNSESEEKAAALDAEQNEKAPAPDSSAESSENPEKKEAEEESNQN
jgi:type II secretory pathway component GspD/PulD (secretin)